MKKHVIVVKDQNGIQAVYLFNTRDLDLALKKYDEIIDAFLKENDLYIDDMKRYSDRNLRYEENHFTLGTNVEVS